MKPLSNGIVLLALAVSIAHVSGVAMADQPKTAKERLSDKASDDQRVDDCGVPIAQRGPVLRPGCSEDKELAPTEGGQGRGKGQGRR